MTQYNQDLCPVTVSPRVPGLVSKHCCIGQVVINTSLSEQKIAKRSRNFFSFGYRRGLAAYKLRPVIGSAHGLTPEPKRPRKICTRTDWYHARVDFFPLLGLSNPWPPIYLCGGEPAAFVHLVNAVALDPLLCTRARLGHLTKMTNGTRFGAHENYEI